MIHDEFISEFTAKRLRGVGFPQKQTFACYNASGKLCKLSPWMVFDKTTDAPSLGLALRFIREKFGLFIEISFNPTALENEDAYRFRILDLSKREYVAEGVVNYKDYKTAVECGLNNACDIVEKHRDEVAEKEKWLEV